MVHIMYNLPTCIFISFIYINSIENVTSNPIEKNSEENPNTIKIYFENECRHICEQCLCLGFYCGEECICECSNDTLDQECLKTLTKDNYTYEVLVQSPNGTRMARDAYSDQLNSENLKLEENNEKVTVDRKRRSVITPVGEIVKENSNFDKDRVFCAEGATTEMAASIVKVKPIALKKINFKSLTTEKLALKGLKKLGSANPVVAAAAPAEIVVIQEDLVANPPPAEIVAAPMKTVAAPAPIGDAETIVVVTDSETVAAAPPAKDSNVVGMAVKGAVIEKGIAVKGITAGALAAKGIAAKVIAARTLAAKGIADKALAAKELAVKGIAAQALAAKGLAAKGLALKGLAIKGLELGHIKAGLAAGVGKIKALGALGSAAAKVGDPGPTVGSEGPLAPHVGDSPIIVQPPHTS